MHSVLANRLSYLLDLRGPSISVDTACSSSLVAIHLACQSLRYGESDIALAGGVSLMITEGLMISLSKVGFMAPDGRCKTFDASADGFGRGEGCGVVVLKRLADAIADGDRVLAADPRLGGQPGRPLHGARRAERPGAAGADPRGAGQRAARARSHRLRRGARHRHGAGRSDRGRGARRHRRRQRRPAAAPCLLGAAKANIGHLEAAAGVTGVIKSVLVLQHDAMPPQVHFKALNPHISLAGTRLADADAV